MGFATIMIFTGILFFQFNKCSSKAKVNVIEKSGSRVKLKCPPTETLLKNVTDKETLLWEGAKFGPKQLKRIALNDPNIHSIRYLNTIHLKCVLKALKSNRNIGTRHSDYVKNRKERETSGRSVKSKNLKNITSREERKLAGIPQKEAGNCPPGHRIHQDKCFPCFPGSYTSGQETECFLCPRDFYSSFEGADACWPCPQGTKTAGEGADSERKCVGDPLNRTLKTSKVSSLWIILIIFLILFLLVTWIFITFLLIRIHRRRGPVKRKDGETGSKDLFNIPFILNSKHKNNANKRKGRCRHNHHKGHGRVGKHLKFDVDIKGSAILTGNNSSSCEFEENLVTHNKEIESFDVTGTARNVTSQLDTLPLYDVISNAYLTDEQSISRLLSSENVSKETLKEYDVRSKNSHNFDDMNKDINRNSRTEFENSSYAMKVTTSDLELANALYFGNGNSDRDTAEPAHNSEAIKKCPATSSSLDELPREVALNEIQLKNYQDASSIIGNSVLGQSSLSGIVNQESQEKQFSQVENALFSNSGTFPSKDDNANLKSVNSREELAHENYHFGTHTKEYQTADTRQSEENAFKKSNYTTPTSCPLHQHISNRCHVEVVLIPFP